jgi:hypothetical protein
MSRFQRDIRRLWSHFPRRIMGATYPVPKSRRTDMGVAADKSADATAIRPLTGEIPKEDLDDLRARVIATRWPEKETVDDLSQGPRLDTIQALAR